MNELEGNQIKGFIDENGDVYAFAQFNVRNRMHSRHNIPLRKNFEQNFVKQDVRDIIFMCSSGLTLFMIDSSNDLWLMGWFSFFKYFNTRMSLPEGFGMNNPYDPINLYKWFLVDVPIKINIGFKVIDATIYKTWAFFLDENGNIWKLGSNTDENITHLYYRMPDEADELIKISSGTKFRKISCGKYHLSAIDEYGNLWTYNYPEKVFKRITSGFNFDFIASGSSTVVAIDANGDIYFQGACSKNHTAVVPVKCKMGAYSSDFYPELTKIQSDIKFQYVSMSYIDTSRFIDTNHDLWECNYIDGTLRKIDAGVGSIFMDEILTLDGDIFMLNYSDYTFNKIDTVYDIVDGRVESHQTKVIRLPGEKNRPRTNTKSARKTYRLK
jgi:hypothetical protein